MSGRDPNFKKNKRREMTLGNGKKNYNFQFIEKQ